MTASAKEGMALAGPSGPAFAAAFGPFGEAKDNFCVRQACAALEQLIQRTLKSDSQAVWSPPLELDLHSLAVKLFCDGLCQKECFILAFIYGQRLLKKSSFGLMSAQNVYRFFLVSVMVASKFLDDLYCRNSYFAAAGGMSTAELNALEVRFCFLMDFRLAVSAEEYEACVESLMTDSSLLPRAAPISLFSVPPCYPPAVADVSAMAVPPPMYHPHAMQQAVGSCALPLYYPPAPPLWSCWDLAKIWMPLPPGGAAALASSSSSLSSTNSSSSTASAVAAQHPHLRFDPLGAASAWFAHCPTA